MYNITTQASLAHLQLLGNSFCSGQSTSAFSQAGQASFSGFQLLGFLGDFLLKVLQLDAELRRTDFALQSNSAGLRVLAQFQTNRLASVTGLRELLLQSSKFPL